MKKKILEFYEKKKFIDEDDVGEHIKFILDKNELVIRSSCLQENERILQVDKLQVK